MIIEELAQENERRRQELQDRRFAEMDRLENLTNRAEAAEATCQSLIDQSSRWEAQALEAEARLVECEGVSLLRDKSGKVWERQAHAAEDRCAELEAKCREYETFCASIARTYGEGPISNTSEPQEGKEGSRG